ncbi:hypothetical protein ASE63_01685 [Bosea sp. Root381]|uniref:hypothetical protein n=1 Tax=Bosea sp. Root381 TaxID=1736524 RepID=UPI0006FB8682|nr:hypothetical protein [Bosea sp. Root381]KRE17930.1 hypothetical protein ASE63_01685 [Bosea sp. Root381]
MSTIAARAHHGASLSAPVRRAAPKPRRKTSWLGRIARTALHRPGRALVLLVFASVSAVILANALFFQKARHPAPMVAAPAQPAPARAVERRVEQPAVMAEPVAPAIGTQAPAFGAPLPPVRPSDLPQQARESAVRPPAAVTNVPRTAAAPAPAPVEARRAAPARDPIADLINGDMRPPGEIRGVAQARSNAPRRSAEN